MRKKSAVAAVLAGLAVAGATGAMAAEASATLDLASAYVFRGATFNDGLVAQPGLEVSGMPVTVGVWGNVDIDDYDGALDEGQFSEVDLYASYDLPMPEGCLLGLSVGYTEYLYPGFGGAVLETDVDGKAVAAAVQGESDREFSLSAGLDLPLSPSVTVYYGVAGGLEDSVYVEGAVGHGFTIAEKVSLDLGALVAYSSPDAGEDGFSHVEASASLGYSVFSAGVTYIGQIDDEVLVDVEDGGAYDVEVVGVLGVGYDF